MSGAAQPLIESMGGCALQTCFAAAETTRPCLARDELSSYLKRPPADHKNGWVIQPGWMTHQSILSKVRLFEMASSLSNESREIYYFSFFFFFFGRRAPVVPRAILPRFVLLSPLPICAILLFERIKNEMHFLIYRPCPNCQTVYLVVSKSARGGLQPQRLKHGCALTRIKAHQKSG